MSKETIIIEEDTLKSIKEIREVQTNIQIEVGGIEAQKHLLLHRLHEYGESLQKIMKDLQDELGEGSLDLETGEFVLKTE